MFSATLSEEEEAAFRLPPFACNSAYQFIFSENCLESPRQEVWAIVMLRQLRCVRFAEEEEEWRAAEATSSVYAVVKASVVIKPMSRNCVRKRLYSACFSVMGADPRTDDLCWKWLAMPTSAIQSVCRSGRCLPETSVLPFWKPPDCHSWPMCVDLAIQTNP